MLLGRTENESCRSADIATDFQRQTRSPPYPGSKQGNGKGWSNATVKKSDNSPICPSVLRLSLHPMYDQWISKSPLNSGPLEWTRPDQENKRYREEHFLMIWLKKQNTPAGRRVQANPCCATALQRQLILLQFRTASQSFNILIHSMQ